MQLVDHQLWSAIEEIEQILKLFLTKFDELFTKINFSHFREFE